MRRIRIRRLRKLLRAAGSFALLAFFVAGSALPAAAQESDAAESDSTAAGAASDAEGPLAPDDEAERPVIEAQPQPILTEKEYAAVPKDLHPHLDAINAALEQLSSVVRSTKDPAELRRAAQTAMTELQTARRVLQYYGIRVEDRGGKLVDIVADPIGVEASNALGLAIGDAIILERGLRYCLELFPNTCHQRLRGDLTALSRFDPSTDLELPEGKKRLARTETLGMGALVVAYLPDPVAPVARKPRLTGDDEIDVQRRTQAAKEYEEAMADFREYRIQVQEARRPHTIVNYALATGDLLDIITFEREIVNAQGEKEKIVSDPVKHLRGPNDPTDEVTARDLWALIVKLDQEDQAFRQSLAHSEGATSVE